MPSPNRPWRWRRGLIRGTAALRSARSCSRAAVRNGCGSWSAAAFTACATVWGMSWNFRSRNTSKPRPLLIGVTVLTSMNESDLHEIGFSGSIEEQVARLAGLTQHAGLDGVVCSAREARSLRARFGPHFKLVTPGIRPHGAAQNDQQRSLTPVEALRAGADYLVIGRPITQAADPMAALAAIQNEIERVATLRVFSRPHRRC